MAFYLKRSIAKNGKEVETMTLVTAEILYNHLLENTQLSNESSFDYSNIYLNNYDIFTPEDIENSLLDHFIDLEDASIILSMNHIAILSIFLLKHSGQISDYQILSLMKMSDGSSRLERLLGLLLVEKKAERKRYLLYDKIEKQILAKKLGPKAAGNSYFLRYFISNGKDISSAENEWKNSMSSFISGLNLGEGDAKSKLTKERVEEITKVFTDDPTSKNLTLPGVAFLNTYRCLKYGNLLNDDGTYDFAIIKGNIGRRENISLLDFVSDLPYRLYLENPVEGATETDTEINVVEKAKEISNKFKNENKDGWENIFIDEKKISNTPILSDLIYDSLSQSDLSDIINDFENRLVESVSEFFKKTNSMNDDTPTEDFNVTFDETMLKVFEKYLLSQNLAPLDSEQKQLKKYYVENASSAKTAVNKLAIESKSLDILKAYGRSFAGMWAGKDALLQTATTLALLHSDLVAMATPRILLVVLLARDLEIIAMLALICIMLITKYNEIMAKILGSFGGLVAKKIAAVLQKQADRANALLQSVCVTLGLASQPTKETNLSECLISPSTGRVVTEKQSLDVAQFRTLDTAIVDIIPNIDTFSTTLYPENRYAVLKSGQGEPPLIQPYSEIMMKRLYDVNGDVSDDCIKSALDAVFSNKANKDILYRAAINALSSVVAFTNLSVNFNTFYYFLTLVKTFAATQQISFGLSGDPNKHSWAHYVKNNMGDIIALKKDDLKTVSQESNGKFALKHFFNNFFKDNDFAIKTLSTALAYKDYITNNQNSDVLPQSIVDMFVDIFSSDYGRTTLQTMTESYNDITSNIEVDGRIKVGLSKAELLFLKQDLTNLISDRESIRTSLNIQNGPSLLAFQYAMAFLYFYKESIGIRMTSLYEEVTAEDKTTTGYYQSNPASLEGIGSAFNRHVMAQITTITESNSSLEVTDNDNPFDSFIKELISLNNIQQFYQKTINIESYEVIDTFMKSDAYKILKDGV